MRCVECWLGDQRCALALEVVEEVLPLVEARKLVGVPDWIVGMAHLRGSFVPLVDATLLVTGVQTVRTMNARVALMNASSCGGMKLSLLVSRMGGVVTADFESETSHPGITGAGRGALAAITADALGEISLIDPAKMFTAEQRRAFRDTAGVS